MAALDEIAGLVGDLGVEIPFVDAHDQLLDAVGPVGVVDERDDGECQLIAMLVGPDAERLIRSAVLLSVCGRLRWPSVEDAWVHTQCPAGHAVVHHGERSDSTSRK